MSTKILALCDALGNLLKFALMPGQRHDSKGVEEMIRNQKFEALLADKAFDVQWLIAIASTRRANRDLAKIQFNVRCFRYYYASTVRRIA